MKKTNFIPILLAVALLFTGCGAGKPVDVVEGAIKCLQENKLEDARQYFAKIDMKDGTEAVEGTDSGTETGTENAFSNAILDVMNDFAKEHAKDITYEIKDTEEDGDEATVEVDVTYKDAGPVTKLAYQDLIKQSVSSALTGSLTGDGSSSLEDSDISAMFVKSFEKAQESAAFMDKTDTLKVSCKKVDGKWKISDSTDLLNVYYGNIINTLDKLTSDSSDDSSSGTDASDTETTEQSAGDTGTDSKSDSSTSSDSASDDASDSDITLYEDMDMKSTTNTYTMWDDTGEIIVDMTYIGENSTGQRVGNFNFTFNDNEDSDNSQQISGTFVENSDETGIMTDDNGRTTTYSIYWSDDHDNMMITGNDGTQLELMNANWARNNVG